MSVKNAGPAGMTLRMKAVSPLRGFIVREGSSGRRLRFASPTVMEVSPLRGFVIREVLPAAGYASLHPRLWQCRPCGASSSERGCRSQVTLRFTYGYGSVAPVGLRRPRGAAGPQVTLRFTHGYGSVAPAGLHRLERGLRAAGYASLHPRL